MARSRRSARARWCCRETTSTPTRSSRRGSSPRRRARASARPLRRLALRAAKGAPKRRFRAQPARGPGLRDPGRGQQLRLRIVARACALGAQRLWLSRGGEHADRGHLPRNALKNGLLPVIVDQATHGWLLEHPGADLRHRSGEHDAHPARRAAVRFPLEPFARYCLMNGVDELGISPRTGQEIRGLRTEVARMKARIAVLPGDGIGPEVMAQGLRVLRAVAEALWTQFDADRAALRRGRHRSLATRCPGRPLRPVSRPTRFCSAPSAAPSGRRPKPRCGRSRGSSACARRSGVYANLRPVTVHPALLSFSLKPEIARGRGSRVRARAHRRNLLREKTRGRAGRRRMSAVHGGGSRAHREGGGASWLGSGGAGSCRSTSRTCSRPRGCGARGDHAVDEGRVPGRIARAHAGRLGGDAPHPAAARFRRAGDREHVRRHPHRRGIDVGGIAGAAAVGFAG